MIRRLDYPPYPINLHVTSQAEASMRIRSCDKEPETIEWVQSLEPGPFFDVGANCGAYSFVAACLGHTTYAFEPHPATFARLEQNIELNSELKVFAYQVLLGEQNASVDMSWSSLQPGSALHCLGGAGEHVERLQMTTLDVFVATHHLPYPRYLKIDTDGSELSVLSGAEVCLSHVQSLQVEIDEQAPARDRVPDFLFGHGFAETKVTPHPWSGVSNRVYDRYEVAR